MRPLKGLADSDEEHYTSRELYYHITIEFRVIIGRRTLLSTSLAFSITTLTRRLRLTVPILSLRSNPWRSAVVRRSALLVARTGVEKFPLGWHEPRDEEEKGADELGCGDEWVEVDGSVVLWKSG